MSSILPFSYWLLLLVLFSCLRNRILTAELVKVKSAFYLFENAASLECVHPKFSDTTLRDFDMGDLLERLKSQMSEPFMTEIENSGLVEAATFPLAITCPKLVRKCINRFDITTPVYKERWWPGLVNSEPRENRLSI